MKNVLDYLTIPFVIAFVLIYLLLGVVFDICTKLVAAIICLTAALVCILITLFIPNRPKLKVFRNLYNYGGRWEFNRNNYYVTNKLLNKYLYD